MATLPAAAVPVAARNRTTHRDDLPDESEDDVLPALPEDVAVHVDHVAADGLRRVDGQGQVLVALEQGQLGAAVDHPVEWVGGWTEGGREGGGGNNNNKKKLEKKSQIPRTSSSSS